MNLLQDLRFAIRLLIKDRGFTFVAVLALALGIGVNATVFTFVNAVLIRGLPFDDPDRIMSIGDPRREGPRPRTVLSRLSRLAREHPHPVIARRFQRRDDEHQRRGPDSRALFRTLRLDQCVSSDRTEAAARPRLPSRRRRPRRRGGGDAGSRNLEQSLRRRSGSGRTNDQSQRHAGHRDRRHAGRLQVPARRGRLAAAGADAKPAATETRRAYASRIRPARAGRHARAGPRRAREHRQSPCARLPRHEQGHQAERDDLQRALQRRRDQARVPVADGRRRVRAADCVRQRRESAARSIGRACPRNVGSGLTRCNPLADRPATAGREPVALGARRHAGPGTGVGWRQALRAGDGRRRQAVLDSVHDGQQGPGVFRGRLPWHRRDLRARACASRLKGGFERGAEGRRAGQQRRRSRQALDQRADRRRTRADAGAAGRRRIHDAKLRGAVST